MSPRQEILAFVRETRAQAADVPDDTRYSEGYVDALSLVEEMILDAMWRDGEDDDDDSG